MTDPGIQWPTNINPLDAKGHFAVCLDLFNDRMLRLNWILALRVRQEKTGQSPILDALLKKLVALNEDIEREQKTLLKRLKNITSMAAARGTENISNRLFSGVNLLQATLTCAITVIAPVCRPGLRKNRRPAVVCSPCSRCCLANESVEFVSHSL